MRDSKPDSITKEYERRVQDDGPMTLTRLSYTTHDLVAVVRILWQARIWWGRSIARRRYEILRCAQDITVGE